MTRVASSVSTGSPARLSVWSVTSMRSPMWRSSVFTCSSCWPSSSRKRRGSSKRSAREAAGGGEHVARGTARELPLELGNALLELALLREELLELRGRLLLGAAQERGDLAQQRLVATDRVERTLAGRRLEPPHAGRHAT